MPLPKYIVRLTVEERTELKGFCCVSAVGRCAGKQRWPRLFEQDLSRDKWMPCWVKRPWEGPVGS